MLFAPLIILLATTCAAPLAARFLGREAGWLLALPLVVAAGLIGSSDAWTPGVSMSGSVAWMPTLDVGLSFRLDGLSLLFSLLVLVIGAGILIYSTRYLGAGGRHGSFYLLMTLFALAMLTLVLADDLVLFFVAWEATTLCSFFLISRSGHEAREPAIRTLLVTVAGGLSLLTAISILIVATGTTSISGAFEHSFWQEDSAGVTAVAVLLALAAFTKSAQFPFQAWLPDSMVAITPVSAYLHAAAMVKAGIYLLLRFSPVLAETTVWSSMLIVSGLITALFGAVAALRRFDLKELLAYSTISQLGLLVTMIGVGTTGALTAAVLHTVSHALFKSSLFMLVGSIDHQAGTRDIRDLAKARVQMPLTVGAMAVAAASMAGIPLLVGFISKELMFTAFVGLESGSLAVVATIGAAVVSALTFAYSFRIVLGARGGRGGRAITESPAVLWGVPMVAAGAGLILGVIPGLLDRLISSASGVASGGTADTHLELWHGWNTALMVSIVVITVGTLLVLKRHRIQELLAPLDLPLSGLAAVDWLRAATIRLGGRVGNLAGSRSPWVHLGIPVVALTGLAAIGAAGIQELPSSTGPRSRTSDWVIVGLIAIAVLAAIRARTRLSAVVVTGFVGFSMTLWFFILGAADVAMTQLLVEILTVCVMVLVLSRLPVRFKPASLRRRATSGTIAVAAGLATTLGVWALTGRRDHSEAATDLITEGEDVTGGSNIVNTILVEFRALDTLGELTVLGVSGMAMAALLKSRRPAAPLPPEIDYSSPLANASENSVFMRTITRALGPGIILLSLILLLRGHNEPGGGFISALIGGAGVALLYLSARSNETARVRAPYMVLIGAGIIVGAASGLAGFIGGSFLTPVGFDLFGFSMTTALIFDVGVYLAVIGVIVAAFNILGLKRESDVEDATVRSLQ